MTPTGKAGRRMGRRAGLVAFLAATLVVPLAPASSAAAPQVVIQPTADGNTAVRSGQTVTVSGDAPDGALTSARLIGLLADGSAGGVQRINGAELGTDDDVLRGGDYLKVEGGQFEGRLTLQCVFAPPNKACFGRTAPSTADIRDVVLEVVVAGQVLQSGSLRVDYTRPGIRDAKLVAADRVVVRMTEPVRYPPLQPEAGGDWEVAVGGEQVPVTRVDGPTTDDCVGGYGPEEDERAGRTGCSRTLVLDAAIGGVDEDAEPVVDYVLFDNRVPEREDYSDFTSNRLRFIGTGTRLAVDRIRPPTPRIDGLAGRVPGAARVDASDPAPTMQISNLRAGHSAFAQITDVDGVTFQTEPVDAAGPTVELALPPLATDGDYRIEAVVRDPAGNLSTDATQAKRADASPSVVTYGLDRVVPQIVGAVVDGDTVLIGFTEPVGGENRPGDWTVTAGETDYAVTGVNGTGATRTLEVAGVPDRALVSYQPATTGRYTDPAGNAVPDTTVPANGVPLPVVTTPDGPVVTSAREVVVRGASSEGLRLDVFRDDDGDGAPDGEPIATGGVGADDRFAVATPLRPSVRNDLLVIAVDEAAEPDVTSRPAAVPPVVQDAVPPTLELAYPVGGEVLAGGSEMDVRFTGCDANPGRVTVLYAEQGANFAALTTVPLAATCDEDTATTVELPDRGTESARVRLVADDLAGNVARDTSASFVVDAAPPTFTAVTRAAREVHLTFSEPVSGTLRGTDWLVKGARASTIEAMDGGGTAVQADAATRFVLRTMPPAPGVGPNETPDVVYAPPFASAPAPAGGELVDRAGQSVADADRAVEAVDGIVPAAPAVTSPESPTYQAAERQRYAGTAEAGTTLRLIDEDGNSASPSVRVSDAGGWEASGALRRNTTTVLRAVVVDAAGNTSPLTAAPGVVQDSLNPSVVIDAPKAGQTLPLDSDVEVRWRSGDANLVPEPVVVDITTDGGQTWQLLGEDQPASGSLTWRTPSEPTSKAGVRVRALDLAGRTGTATEGFIGVGTAADPGVFAPPDEPLAPLPAQVLDAMLERGPLGRVVGALPATGIELVKLVLFGIVILLTGAGIVMAGRNQRRRPT